MKIAIIRQKYVNYGGAEQFVSEYTTHLAEAGHEVHIFAHQWTPSAHPNIRIHPVRALTLNSFFRTLSFAWFAARAVRRESFDVVQSHERTWCQDVYRAGDGCHREWLERRSSYLPPLKKWSFRFNWFHQLILKLEKHIFEGGQCKKIIAISEMVKCDILKHYCLPAEKVEVVYNGVRLDRFHPDNKRRYRNEVRERVGVPKDVVMILFVGSGFERKGLKYLVRAVGLLGCENWRLVLAGKGGWNRYLRFASEQTREKIIALDPVNDIETLYAAADLFVLPSMYEPFGNANLEALASGLPIVTSRNTGVAEIIEPKKEGMIVEDPSNPKAIAEAIVYLMDPKVREPMGKFARLLAERFTQKRNAEAMLRIYRAL